MGSLNKVIVNFASVGTWHEKGQKRLLESLSKEKEESAIFFATLLNCQERNWYEKKIALIKQVSNLGYRFILWLDASITLIDGKTLDPIFEYTKEHGVYLYASGYKAGQTANSKALEYFETNTNELMTVPEVAANVICIDTESEVGKLFLDIWAGTLNSEANTGEKWASEDQAIRENPDPRFLFSRHDQTTASLTAWKIGAPIDMESLFVYRDGETPQKESSIFRLKGG